MGERGKKYEDRGVSYRKVVAKTKETGERGAEKEQLWRERILHVHFSLSSAACG